MMRPDISDDLIHWTKGENYTEAFNVLLKILECGYLKGGKGCIKGGYTCVCFTETPMNSFHQAANKYKPFGIQVAKKWLYQKGGRPVIYQPDSDYDILSDGFKWKHVRYEPAKNPPIDFSWEREWRIPINELHLELNNFFVILPNQKWADKLLSHYVSQEQNRVFEKMVNRYEPSDYGSIIDYVLELTPDLAQSFDWNKIKILKEQKRLLPTRSL